MSCHRDHDQPPITRRFWVEHWASDQLQRGALNWRTLPSQLQSSGELLRQGLRSHAEARSGQPPGAVSLGLGGLLSQPEFERSESLRPLLQLVEEEPTQVLKATQAEQRGGVWIGSEHPHPALHACAVVQANYCNANGNRGQVALIGPMRMAYATARAAVRAVAQCLERRLR